MNTITTKDGLSFRLSDQTYNSYLAAYTKYGECTIEGNLITRDDKPQFRTTKEKPAVLSLAEGVFSQPNHIREYNLGLAAHHARYAAEHRGQRRIHYSLLAAVQRFVQETMDIAYHFDAETVFSLADANYDYLDRYNVPPSPVKMTDREVLVESARESYTLGSDYFRGDYIRSLPIPVSTL